MKNVNRIKYFLILIAAATVFGCASTYTIQSNPPGARVYFVEPGTDRKVYLGATPLNYSKQSLPMDRAFALSLSKEGFKDLDIPMAATDESRTVVNAALKPDEDMLTPNAKELNTTIRILFSVQELIYSRHLHEAIVELDKLLKEKPHLVKAHTMKGTAYYLLNDMGAAMASWNEAVKLDPTDLVLRKFVDQKRSPATSTDVKGNSK